MNLFKRKENYKVFVSLMFMQLVPFFYTLIRTSLVNSIPDDASLNIIGQIEWFDLIDETLQAFLIMPIYAVLNRTKQNQEQYRQTIGMTLLSSAGLYTAFSFVVMLYAESLARTMEVPDLFATVVYLRLETVGFILGIVSAFANVVFVIFGKSGYIIGLTVLNTAAKIIGDLVLIPAFGVNGVACTDILINAGVSFFCLAVLLKKKYISFRLKPDFFKQTLLYYARVGFFSGAEIFLNNFIYAYMVCKMVNTVQSQGIYWEANNFIWGFLLIPVNAMSEIIRQESDSAYQFSETKRYLKTAGIICLSWIVTAPVSCFLLKLMKTGEDVTRIILVMLPFYVVYAVTQVFHGQFTGLGKTHYNLIVSLFCNILYYGIWYLLFLNGMIQFTLMTICMEFGFGMVFGLLIDIAIVFSLKRKKQVSA